MAGTSQPIIFKPDKRIVAGEVIALVIGFAVLSHFSGKGISVYPENGKLLFVAVLLGFVLIIMISSRISRLTVYPPEGLIEVRRTRFFIRADLSFDLSTTQVRFVARQAPRGGRERYLRITDEVYAVELGKPLSGWSTALLEEIKDAVDAARTPVS